MICPSMWAPVNASGKRNRRFPQVGPDGTGDGSKITARRDALTNKALENEIVFMALKQTAGVNVPLLNGEAHCRRAISSVLTPARSVALARP